MKLLSMAALAASAAAMAPPALPTQYFVKGKIELPYGNITEPYVAFVDEVNGRETLQYWNGLDTFVYRADLNTTWQVNPVLTNFDCFLTNGTQPSIARVIPDISNGYTYQGQTVFRGQQVYDWRSSVSNSGRTSTYDLYISVATDAPVAFHMLGYDATFGSHFDEYIILYEHFASGPSSLPENIFNEPTGLTCGGFPAAVEDEGAAGYRGQAMFMELVPQNGAPQPPVGPKNDQAFMEFIESFGKNYGSEQELRERQSIFTKNRRLISHHNRKAVGEGRSMRLAMNFLGDATQLERTMRRGRIAKKNADGEYNNGAHSVHPEPSAEKLASLPTAVDWLAAGAVAQVPDQGICGSCWAHGSSGMLEGMRYVKYGILEVLSKQELMDCSWNYGNYACDGGEDFQAYQWIMQNGGLSTKQEYGKYLQADGFCKVNTTAAGQRSIPPAITIQSYVNITGVPALLDALANVGPISISVDASLPTFDFYSSGVYDDPACLNGYGDLDHSILATGYGVDATTGQQYFIVRNNWSTHWGNQNWGPGGYMFVATENNICGVATAPTYAILG